MSEKVIEVVRPGTGRKVIRLSEWAAHKALGFVPCDESEYPENPRTVAEADSLAADAAAAAGAVAAQEVEPGLEGLAVPEPTPEPVGGDDGLLED